MSMDRYTPEVGRKFYADGRVRRASWDEEWDGTGIEPVILDCRDYSQDEESGEFYGPDHEAFGEYEAREAVAEITTAILEAIGDDTEAWTVSLGVTA